MIRKQIGKVKNASDVKRQRRKLSIRKKVAGTSDRPRLSITRSNKHITVQAVDDAANKTLFSVQTYGKNAVKANCNVEGGKLIGAELAKKLGESNIKNAVFDRNGYRYHGVVAAVVEAARENGIQI